MKLAGQFKVAKPVNTFENMKAGSIKMPEQLVDPKTKILKSKDGASVEFFNHVPTISEMKEYEGLKVQKFLIGGESNGLK